jgi:hypothetical protein
MRSSQIRRIFLVELFRLICVVWPILSGVLFAMVGPGLLIGRVEGWRIDDALYFKLCIIIGLGANLQIRDTAEGVALGSL